MTPILHIGAAPDTFNVAWLGTERVFDELGADICEGLVRQHLDVLRVVAQEPEVRDIVTQKFTSAAYSHLEVAVVAAADDAVDYVGALADMLQ